jgi:hypothetical protein
MDRKESKAREGKGGQERKINKSKQKEQGRTNKQTEKKYKTDMQGKRRRRMEDETKRK